MCDSDAFQLPSAVTLCALELPFDVLLGRWGWKLAPKSGGGDPNIMLQPTKRSPPRLLAKDWTSSLPSSQR